MQLFAVLSSGFIAEDIINKMGEVEVDIIFSVNSFDWSIFHLTLFLLAVHKVRAIMIN